MNAVELFSGIGGFRLAAERLGINTIWANDNCPGACQVYRQRFGSKELQEDALLAVQGEIPPHDLLTAGFPCQPFSSAGKKKGLRDPRGTLFEVVVEILRRHQPQYFILENVKRLLTMERGLHFATILDALAELNYSVEWRLLNAMHFGLPQNRQRVFLLGVREKRETRSTIPVIRLATSEDLATLNEEQCDALAAPAFWRSIAKPGLRFPCWGMARAGKFFAADLHTFSLRTALVPLRTILEKEVPAAFDFTEATLKWLQANTPVNRFVQEVEILSNQSGGARMGYTIFGIQGVAPTLTSTTSRHYERYKIGDRYRRLTNIEYARIQGFADDHCAAVSVYEQYALLGNAVPPPVARWVMERSAVAGIPCDAVPRKNRPVGLFDHAY